VFLFHVKFGTTSRAGGDRRSDAKKWADREAEAAAHRSVDEVKRRFGERGPLSSLRQARCVEIYILGPPRSSLASRTPCLRGRHTADRMAAVVSGGGRRIPPPQAALFDDWFAKKHVALRLALRPVA
jgi:hypothetical protein